MPRRSRENLTVIPAVPGQQRPPAPQELTAAEAEQWNAIVGALPAGWFTAAALPVLRALCAHIVSCEDLEVRLRAMRGAGRLDHALLREHRLEAARVERLSTSLRLTPRSRYSPRSTANQVAQAKLARPWEVRADSSQPWND
jgi:hypothetical protein